MITTIREHFLLAAYTKAMQEPNAKTALARKAAADDWMKQYPQFPASPSLVKQVLAKYQPVNCEEGEDVVLARIPEQVPDAAGYTTIVEVSVGPRPKNRRANAKEE